MTSLDWSQQVQTLCRMRCGPRIRAAACCLMVFVALGIAAGLLFIFAAATGMRNLILAGTLAAAPVPLYIAITLWLDRFEAEPLWMLGVCFVWGATAAALIALVVNQEAMLFLGLHLQPWDAHMDPTMLGVMFAAPAAEELAKGSILLLLFWWNREEFDGVLDGIIYAAMAGLGFAMTENIVYYALALMEHGPWGLTSTLLLRGLIFPFQHPLFTSFLGIGLGMAAVSPRKAVRRLAPLVGLAMSILLHFLWNVSTIDRHFFVAGYLLVSVPVMLGVIALILLSLRRESKIIWRHLQADVQRGRLTPQEHRRLSRLSRRWAYDLRCLLHHGLRGGWASIRFHQAATELAFFRHHIATGRLTADPEREAQYLQHLARIRVTPWGKHRASC